MKLLLLPLLCLFSSLFSSVQSCRTVSKPNATLTGVCPNDTFTVPIGKVLNYECTADYNGSFLLYWNISGVTVNQATNPIPSGISIGTSGNNYTLTIMATANTVREIYCGLCRFVHCVPSPEKFIGTKSVQLITFGKTDMQCI